MKVGIPGRAVKMPENLGGSRGHVTLGPLARSSKIPYNKIEIKPAFDYLTLGCNDESKKAPGKAYKKELKSKGNIRPSTAVRRHVKKISEEFTMMHNKYESSSTKTQDPKDKASPKSAPPGSSTALGKMPPSRFPRAVLGKISCSKCEALKGTGSAKGGGKGAPSQPCKHHRTSMSPKRSGSPQKKSCLAPTSNAPYSGSSPRSRPKYGSGRGCGGLEYGLAPSSPCAPRSPGRKKDMSPRAQPSTEQIKKAKIFTEKAIMEGRVFSIFGYFPAIKEALKSRGWVEKIQHSVPYVHPHPNNCVCPHVGYTSVYMSPPPLIASTSTTSTTTTTTTTTTATNTTSATTCTSSSSSAASTSSDSGISSGVSLDQTDSASAVGSTSGAEDAADEATPEGPDESTSPDPPTSLPPAPPPSLTTSSSSTSRSSPSPPAGQDVGHPEDTTTANTTSSSIADDKTSDAAVPESLSSSSSQRSDESSSSTEESSKPLELFRDHEINTSILGPSEIRKGLSNCITEKNSALFKYSTTNILKKIRSRAEQRSVKLLSEEENEDENIIEEEIEEEEEGEEKQLDEEGEEEEAPEAEPVPEPYNPYVEYKLKTTDMPLVARLLRNVEPNLLWTWTRDSLSFKHLHREQLVNRFPSTPFTTKYGLCGTLQQLHWFSEAASVDTFVPRGFCIGHEDERTAFIHDYRTTACLNMLKWVTERNDTLGPHMVADQHGEVNSKRVRQALSHVEQYIQSCCHDDLDSPPPQALRDHEWGALLAAHYRMVHMDKKIKVATQDRLQNLIADCESALRRVEPFWPQLGMDGLRNLWIVKPGAQSRGRGIFMMNHLEEILALVQSPLIYETKYVVQKYIERPLLIHNTKFDIRQWFMVTDWNPLHVWVYKDSYLRFCSQQYDLTNNNEAIHLSNNAIQCKYNNGERSVELPEENMWDCHQFKDYLRGLKKEAEWDDVIYPGMRDSLVAAMLAAQVEMDTFKHGFELFGADFMLTEDLRPWLIEINSSPCMASTTSVTKRMCGQCLQDVIKVVVDYKHHKNADTGLFELAYRDSEKSIPNPPYLGVNLQVVGRQIKRGPVKPERRKLKRPKPIARMVKPLPMITLSLEETAHHHGSRDHYHPHPHPNPKEGGGFAKRGCSLLDCRRYGVGGMAGGSGGPLPLTSGVSTPVPPITPGDKAISEASTSIIVNCSSPPLKPSNEEKTKPSEGRKGEKEKEEEENEEDEDSTTEDTSEDSSSWSSISRSDSDTGTSRPGSGDT